MTSPVFMSVKEVARLLGVPRHRVQQLIHEHKLKARKLGRTWLIDRVDLLTYTQPIYTEAAHMRLREAALSAESIQRPRRLALQTKHGERKIRVPSMVDRSALVTKTRSQDPDPVAPAYVSIKEAAQQLGVSRQRVNQLIHQGKLTARKIGSSWVVEKSALVAKPPSRRPEPSSADYVSVQEAAWLLGVSRQRVNKLIQENKLEARRVGASWNIKLSAVTPQAHSRDDVPVATPETGEWEAFTGFASLGLRHECLSELASLGLEQVADLPRLVGLVFEGPLGSSVDSVHRRAGLVLAGLGAELHAAFLVRSEVDPKVSVQVDDDTATYRFDLDSPTLRIEASATISESGIEGYLLEKGKMEARTLARAVRRRSIDPLDDLEGVVRNLSDLMDSGRIHTADDPVPLLEARFGLAGEPKMTLEQLGIRSGVTRERIRQRESKALKLLRRPWAVKRLTRVSALVLRLATQVEVAPDDPLVALALRNAFPRTRVNAVAWLRLLAEIHGSAWGPPERRALPGIDAAVADVLAWSGPIRLDVLVVEVAKRLNVAPDPSLLIHVQNSRLCNVDDAGVVQLPDADELDRTTVRVRRLNAMRQVLEAEGPTHFSDLTRRIRPLLSSDDDILERNVHAWLDRYSDRFTWVGPGTYRLRQDGDPAPGRRPLPERYAPSRRRGIGDAIIALLLERQPRSLAEIESHIMPRFVVNEGSIRASIVQDRARRFVLTDDRNVYLSDADIAAFEAAKPKASGLIDWNELAGDIADFSQEVQSPPTEPQQPLQ
jgi:excisionase family DNA binding protein